MSKILIATSHNRLTGVTTFNYTLLNRLLELNNQVEVYISELESDASLVEEKFIALTKTFIYKEQPPNDYDVIIFSDSRTQDRFKNYKAYKIFVVHGLMEDYFIPTITQTDKILCISKFGAEYYKKMYPILVDIEFFPNIIDTTRFNITKPINTKLTSMLILDSRSGHNYLDKFKAIGDKHGIRVEGLIAKDTTTNIWNVEEVINEFDLVIGYGRSLYEAMACGRVAMVYGINGGDGYITKDNFNASFDRNCSGWGIRSLPKDCPIEMLEAEVLKYNFLDGALIGC
jgi:hypothetical protein